MNEKLEIFDDIIDLNSINFCDKFITKNTFKKYLFGRNIYAKNIVEQLDIDGFIDDFTNEKEYLGKPIFKLEEIEKHNSLVLVISGGNTKSALKRVNSLEIECLDYFSFFKYSNLNLKEILFNEGFKNEFDLNKDKFQKVYTLLNDQLSKKHFLNLMNFRYSYNIKYLEDFSNLEDKQYFEDFLPHDKNEVFLDIGGYDGFTSEEFIKKFPFYESIHIFEPELKNLDLAKKRLSNYNNINFHNFGLSNKKATLQFNTSGSASKISEDGDIVIEVDRLDDIINEKVTFIKMDIEGAELDAIDGALETIKNYHPKMAISVYHRPSDFWKILEKIFSIRNDYEVYLRHYTESIYETIMFFIPIKKS